jgi:hypothetical protein
VTTHPPAIRKQHRDSREAQILEYGRKDPGRRVEEAGIDSVEVVQEFYLYISVYSM